LKVQRREILLGALAVGLGVAAKYTAASTPAADNSSEAPGQPSEFIDLWPEEAPGMPSQPPVERLTERSTDPQIQDRALTGIVQPRMAVFRPQAPNGAALMITPGGGYQRVVIDKEGFELGDWFSKRGFTVFVLFYRLPGDGWAAGPDVALSDAQRAMRLIRYRADDFDLDPERVAAMGFSAGGHVCASLATRFATVTYSAVDEADTLSARPFLAAPIYPVISMTLPLAHSGSRALLIGENANTELERAYSPDLNVPSYAPPCFLLHAEDDGAVDVQNTLAFRAALKAQGIPVETHLFANGGHGFGLRQAIGKPAGIWPELFVRWVQSMGLL
jgi:acetyl esterase/lipase